MSLLQNGAYLHDAVIASRLVRAILPRLSILLSSRSQSSTEDEQTPTQGRNRKGKKRARGYEGDEGILGIHERKAQAGGGSVEDAGKEEAGDK